jgi:hypothetical protein
MLAHPEKCTGGRHHQRVVLIAGPVSRTGAASLIVDGYFPSDAVGREEFKP